jgi:hypothetical protein
VLTVSWPLEIVQSIFRVIFDFARVGTLRDEGRPRWLRYSLALSYYVLPTLFLVSVFFSWKLAIIVSVVFLASLIVGAMTEADDPRFQ